jgi:hypothetical protein
MPYGYLILVATVVLAIRHVRSTYASSRSKCLVAGLAAFSVLAPYLWPTFLPLAGWVISVSMFLPWAICVYVIFHQAVYDHEERKSLLQADSPEKASVVEK